MNRNTTEGIRTLIEDNNRQISDKLAELEEWDHKAFRAEMQASINDAREQIIGTILTTEITFASTEMYRRP